MMNARHSHKVNHQNIFVHNKYFQTEAYSFEMKTVVIFRVSSLVLGIRKEAIDLHGRKDHMNNQLCNQDIIRGVTDIQNKLFAHDPRW